MFLLLTFAALSISVSFICSVLEAVLLSITPTFLNVKLQEGKSWAKLMEKYKQDIDKPLIAILTLNTVAHTVGAIGVGATAEQAFGSGNNVVGIVSAVMTILILVVSEIIPKTIGATYWPHIAGLATRVLQMIMFPLKWTGLLWLLQLTTHLIGKDAHVSTVTREEFIAMADAAHTQGVFKETENQAIKSLLKFEQVLARDIMSPKTVLVTADETTTVGVFLENNPDLRFSRIPLYQDNAENVTGFVLKDDVMEAMIAGHSERQLCKLKRPVLLIPRDLPIPQLFEQFLTQREQIAVVVDSFGSVSGVVTMEDVVETLIGVEIVDETDHVADMQKLARENWQERAKRLGVILDDVDPDIAK
mgnify:CR=1 FL=1